MGKSAARNAHSAGLREHGLGGELARLAPALHEALRVESRSARPRRKADRRARPWRRAGVDQSPGRSMRSCQRPRDASASGSGLRADVLRGAARPGHTRSRAAVAASACMRGVPCPSVDAMRAAGEVGQHARRAGLLARGFPGGLVRQVATSTRRSRRARAMRGGRSRSSASRSCRRPGGRSRCACARAAARRCARCAAA